MMINYLIVLVLSTLAVASDVTNNDVQLRKRGFGNFLKGRISNVGKSVKARFKKGESSTASTPEPQAQEIKGLNKIRKDWHYSKYPADRPVDVQQDWVHPTREKTKPSAKTNPSAKGYTDNGESRKPRKYIWTLSDLMEAEESLDLPREEKKMAPAPKRLPSKIFSPNRKYYIDKKGTSWPTMVRGKGMRRIAPIQ